MAEISFAEAASAMGGSLLAGEGAASASGFSIDTRTLRAGDLFFALRGPNHDGHRFLAQAFAAGASGAVVSEPVPAPSGVALVHVGDTLRSLQDLAAHLRRREAVKVVGITGSAGKTTVKEMTHAALDGPVRAYRSAGNLNNLFGLPLALLRMPPGTQVAVLEMGMSTPGEIRRLTEIAAPDVGVLLNVGQAHLANFPSVDAIAEAKGEMFEAMGSRGTGIFNADDDRVRAQAERFAGFTFSFGIERPADLVAEQIVPEGLTGTRLAVRHGSAVHPARIRFLGSHGVYNLLAALAAGFMLGCDLPGMAQRVAVLAPLAGRGALRMLPGDIRLIDDSYNSNPAALRRAIGALASAAPPGGRRVVIAGDMLELGDHGPEAHREAGRHAVESRVDLLVAVGPLSAEAAAAARSAGLAAVVEFPDSAAAAAAVPGLLRPGDTVLVKGSRGMQMERVVAALPGKQGDPE